MDIINYVTPNQQIVTDTTDSYLSMNYVSSTTSQNYQRFILSGGVMGLLSYFVWSNAINLSIQKAIYMGIATLASDLILGVLIRMNYLPNDATNTTTIVAQALAETMLYFPIASGGTVIIPNFTGQAFQQALISAGGSQLVSKFLINPSTTNPSN